MPIDFDKVSRQLGEAEADIAWQAGIEAVDLVKQRIAQYSIKCDLTFGYLHAALHKRQMRGLDAMQAEWEARGYDHFTRLGDSSALSEHIGSDAYVGALHDTGCGHIQPLKYLHGLARAATLLGARIFEAAPVKKILRGPRKTLLIEGGASVNAPIVMLCGNAYLADVGLPEMRRRLAPVTSSILATRPLSDNMVKQILPTGAAVADENAALNYYRIDGRNRMIFGGRASYTNVDFGRTDDDVYFVQGFSGHGVALSGQSGTMMAKAVIGDASQFDVMSKLTHMPFPGGPLRTPALALGMAWFKLRDRLKL